MYVRSCRYCVNLLQIPYEVLYEGEEEGGWDLNKGVQKSQLCLVIVHETVTLSCFAELLGVLIMTLNLAYQKPRQRPSSIRYHCGAGPETAHATEEIPSPPPFWLLYAPDLANGGFPDAGTRFQERVDQISKWKSHVETRYLGKTRPFELLDWVATFLHRHLPQLSTFLASRLLYCAKTLLIFFSVRIRGSARLA